MTPEIQALRDRYRDQMPGMAQFDELAEKYERLLQAQATLDQRWSQASPAKVQAMRTIIQELLEAPAGVAPAVKQRIRDALREAGLL